MPKIYRDYGKLDSFHSLSTNPRKFGLHIMEEKEFFCRKCKESFKTTARNAKDCQKCRPKK